MNSPSSDSEQISQSRDFQNELCSGRIEGRVFSFGDSLTMRASPIRTSDFLKPATLLTPNKLNINRTKKYPASFCRENWFGFFEKSGGVGEGC
jgi:hypothetical protein